MSARPAVRATPIGASERTARPRRRPEQATKIALRALARRHAALTEEIDDLDGLIAPLVTEINPELMACTGVGADVAGQLAATARPTPPSTVSCSAGCAGTRAYVERRTKEGLSKKDIMRCLKRIVARELYYVLRPAQPDRNPALAA